MVALDGRSIAVFTSVVGPDTLSLFGLMQARARAVLLKQLFTVDGSRRVVLPSLEQGDQPLAAMALGLPHLFDEPRTFRAFANRLPEELTPCIWGELTECLIERERCTFDLFARFDVRDERSIHFRALFPSGRDHLIEFRTEHPNLEVAADVARQVVDEAFEHWSIAASGNPRVSYAGAMRLMLDMTLTRGLSLLADRGVSVASALSVWAGFVAFATYYAHVVSFPHYVERSGQLKVPHIGTFYSRLGVSTFEPASDLVRLLSANLPTHA
jgi:hypothetical protein